jgi:hypothetical protein
MAYRSNADAVVREFRRGVDTGLVRAGAVLVAAVQDKLAGGYTTGDFTTGRNMNSVYATPPASDRGGRVVVVTTRQTDPSYPFFWEEGHVNLFAGPKSGGALASVVGSRREGRYLRVPKWQPALEEKTPEITAMLTDALREATAAAGAVFARVVVGGVGRGGRRP